MKRIISLAAALLFAAITVISPAVFAGGGPVVFSMNSVENVSPGESFTVTLSISGEYEAHGMNLSIEFDPNSMTLESCDQGDYLDEARANSGLVVLDETTLAHAGKIKLAVAMPLDPATGSGEVLIMKFHVNEGVTVNQQVIMVIHEFIYMPLSDKTGTDVPFSTRNSIITLNGGTTPDGGYNEGDDGIGNNIPSSPSQPPEPTPGSNIATPAPLNTPAPDGGTAQPGSKATTSPNTTPAAASESAQPAEAITASPDGTVTASPETSDSPADTENADPTASNYQQSSESKTDESRASKATASPVPYIVAGVAAVGAVCSAIVLINKKKRG